MCSISKNAHEPQSFVLSRIIFRLCRRDCSLCFALTCKRSIHQSIQKSSLLEGVNKNISKYPHRPPILYQHYHRHITSLPSLSHPSSPYIIPPTIPTPTTATKVALHLILSAAPKNATGELALEANVALLDGEDATMVVGAISGVDVDDWSSGKL